MNVLACNALHESNMLPHVELQHDMKQCGRCVCMPIWIGLEQKGCASSGQPVEPAAGTRDCQLAATWLQASQKEVHGSRCTILRLLSPLLNALQALRAA